MANFNVDIGKMNKRITIQKDGGITTTPNGFSKTIWNNYKTIWASVNNLFGKEFYSAKAVQAENTVEFVVRYSKDLEKLNTKDFRIFWNNRAFDITFIDNIQYANRWFKFKTVEVVGNE